MQTPTQDKPPLARRLRDKRFSVTDARNALNGIAVPEHLGRETMRACVVRGIRHSADSHLKPEVQELRPLPLFARAINARAIMSNTVPAEPMSDEETPYCIWYPDVASEETYLQLAKKHPRLAYNAARACAVAGYNALYHELVQEHKLLPEVAVAEEARASGSNEIFEAIMSSPIKYSIMDDYTRSLRFPPHPSCLNGDVAARPFLDLTQKCSIPEGGDDDFLPLPGDTDSPSDDYYDDISLFSVPSFQRTTFNITEDWGINEVSEKDVMFEPSTGTSPQLELAMAEYLAQPLPPDLPLGNKDILIRAAAHTGDIDRYSRLRRPFMVKDELFYVIRGIYHNHFFATWWAKYETQIMKSSAEFNEAGEIIKAINARMIMSNDLNRLTPNLPLAYQPYLIWYPDVAPESTYRELARRLPSMKKQIVRAAIYCGYQTLFDELLPDIEPDPSFLCEARARDEPSYYTKAIMERAKQLGLEQTIQDLYCDKWKGEPDWKLISVSAHVHLNSDKRLVPHVPTMKVSTQNGGIYNGRAASPFDAYLWASWPKELLPREGKYIFIDYEEGVREEGNGIRGDT